MDNTLMASVMSGITEREGGIASVGSNAWGNPPSQIFIEPEYQNAHLNVNTSVSTVTNAAAASTPSTEHELRAQNEELRKMVLELQSKLPSVEKASKPYTQIVSGQAQAAPAEQVSQTDIQYITSIISHTVITALSSQFGGGEGTSSIADMAQVLRQQQATHQPQGNQDDATKQAYMNSIDKAGTSGRGDGV
jgi:hypothetical protein